MTITAHTVDQETRAFFLEVPGSKVVYLQVYFELYEGAGTVRTLDIKRSLVCVLTTPTMEPHCRRVLDAIRTEVPWRPAPQPPQHVRDEYILGYMRKKQHAEDHS